MFYLGINKHLILFKLFSLISALVNWSVQFHTDIHDSQYIAKINSLLFNI